MKKYGLLAVAAISICLAACGSKKENKNEEAKTVTGKVYDATMNTIVVVSDQNDTIYVSKMDADPAMVPGVLINDKVKIEYKETKTANGIARQATKLTILEHSPYYYIQGTWVEPNPIAPTEIQGFTLAQDGTAVAVNTATLLFKKWSLNDDNILTLDYESVGNKQTIEGTDMYHVIKIDADSLILRRHGDNNIFRLSRQK